MTALLRGPLAPAPPEPLVGPLVALTTLGDPEVLAALVGAAYVVGPRRGWFDRGDAARLLALTVVTAALVEGSKAALAAPRPPGGAIHAEGYGFPSGHAATAAAVFGGAAALFDRPDAPTRWVGAAGLAGLDGATRLLLRVHYLYDVLAGLALGGAAAVVGARADPERALWAGAAAGVGAVVVSRGAFDPAVVAGVAVGAAGAWSVLRRRGMDLDDRGAGGPVAVAWALCVAALAATNYAAPPLPVGVTVAINGMVGGGLVALPAVQNVSR